MSARIRGFTLLELLVAIAILALVAVGSYRLLFDTISTRDKGMAREHALRDLQRAEMILQRDLMQVAARPIRDEFGDARPAFYLPQENSLEFTRRGWRNPLQEARSDLIRVRYRVENGQLIREHWQVLDRARTSAAQKTVLLDNVSDFHLQVHAKDNWTENWPLLTQTQSDARTLPLPDAVEIRFTLAPWGEIRRVILLPENNADASPAPAPANPQ